jgi:tetratricopeptide (TPR) repeat protein
MILIILTIVSCYQVRYWQNNFTLFNHAVNVTDNNFLAHSSLAGELIKQNKIIEAMHHCQIALSLNPANYNTLVRISVAYNLLGEKNKAMDALRLAIKVHPDYVRAYNDLFVLLLESGKKQEAEEVLKGCLKAIELNSNKDNWVLHYNFGHTLATHGRYEEAVIQYNQALRIYPSNAFAHNNLAMVLLWQGKIDDALNHFRKAVQIQPLYANAHYQLALILKQKGLVEEANSHYQAAIRTNPVYKNK